MLVDVSKRTGQNLRVKAFDPFGSRPTPRRQCHNIIDPNGSTTAYRSAKLYLLHSAGVVNSSSSYSCDTVVGRRFSPSANCCISSFRAGKPRRSRTRIPSAGRKKPLVRVDFLVANTTPLVFFRPSGAGVALQLITGKSIAITHYTRTQHHISPQSSPITMLHIGRAPILYTAVTRVRPSSSSWHQKRFIIIRFDVHPHTEITDRLLVSARWKIIKKITRSRASLWAVTLIFKNIRV